VNDVPGREWLEADGLGGFASGTVTGLRTRRYHALLLTATTPPTGRVVLLNGFDAWVETGGARFELSSQWYAPGVRGGAGAAHIESFESTPWPTWIYRFADGTRVRQEIFVVKEAPVTCVAWKLLSGSGAARITVRPFLSGRDYHALHRSNTLFRFDAASGAGRVAWRPYQDVPGVTAIHNGTYHHDPHWYFNFSYQSEQARGLDCEEDLAAPGTLSWQLDAAQADLILSTTEYAGERLAQSDAAAYAEQMRRREHERRAQFASPLHVSADAYIVQKAVTPGPPRKTIIAGYPWFTDWGRDTFISLRGLCIATGRLADARDILLAWSSTVSEGMVPNRFPDHGARAEFNSVDASLWYVNAVQDYLRTPRHERATSAAREDQHILQEAVTKILEGYSKGTRFNIHVDSDGLLAAGEPGVQLTWMDAKVGDWVVTPRIGKPVEVQALWLNALAFAVKSDARWRPSLELGRRSFGERFWNPQRGCLFDVVDVDHRAGVNDPSVRPNQVFAVGGLPSALLDGERARQVVASVETHLLTPAGLRSLAPDEPGYAAHYAGGVRERDAAYHQGTVWPWLMGAFVEAWLRTHGGDAAARREARRRFLDPLLAGISSAGLGHISEIADGDAPHAPRGCPFQAWSVGEALRLDRVVLIPTHPPQT
jgi:predicted glycogen debranching enzyme